MPRAVLFDLDGVLTTDKTGSQSTLRSLADHTGLPEETLRTAYCRHNRALLNGSTTHAAIWPELCAEAGQEIDLALLHTAFIETPMDGGMLAIAREMKAQGCRIALVTDNKADRVHAILKHHGLHDLFDAVAISAEVGSGKGERAIFDAALIRLGVTAEDCVFIDNTAQNLAVPQAMGMQTILFDDETRDVEGLRRIIGF
ncbi:MAG: HAD-IA family hydrolase [Clostridia bacterium]|nr:HAD-IA family hydrolase [Clostridia bacterium]